MARKPVALGITWDEIEARLLRGLSVRDIADELGCSVQNVHYRIRRRQAEIARNAEAVATKRGGR